MYFCKNCGEQYATDEAVMCVKCGVSKGQGSSYCHNCGKPVTPESVVCLNCGVANNASSGGGSGSNGAKSKMAAGLLAIFLGTFGVHNFYLGYTKKAIIQLVVTIVGIVLSCIVIGFFAVIGVWIWALVEAVMIFTGKIDRDANGIPLTD